MVKEYSIGLDIGTSSVGWSVIGSNNDLIKKKMLIKGNTTKKYIKKNFWGVRLFEEGHTAEDTRIKRVTRRRYIRRRNRINYLQEIFSVPMSEIDKHFFDRLGETFLRLEDKKYQHYPIFGTEKLDKEYHEIYPTIYHLRKKLADSSEKADLRLVYLACSHIIKYRGHFLIEGNFSTNNVSINDSFEKFINVYNQSDFIDEENYQTLNSEIRINQIINEQGSRSKKSESILNNFPKEKSNSLFGQLVKMIVGNQGNFTKIFNLEEEIKLQYSSEEYEQDIEILLGLIGDDYADLFESAKAVYDAIELSNILSNTDESSHAKLSSSMISRYKKHHKELAELKNYIKSYLPDRYYEVFKDSSKHGYAGYIDGGVGEEDFYKYMKKLLSKTSDAESFLNSIENEDFLRKQRTYDNGVIPYQIHLEELSAILNNQSEHYPFLKENIEKIEQILTFRIPYYVGPLAYGNSRFSWVVRKEKGSITPWNLEKKVDLSQSATKFIEKMTNYDLYLPNEKVLPKNSLIYQKYIIFNELTKVKYKDDRGKILNSSSDEKISIFEELFKSKRKVTKKDLINYLENQYLITVTTVEGIEESFNAVYSTYHDLIKQGVPKEFLDESSNEEIIEDIIKILTLFEDRKMIREQLTQYKGILSDKTLKKLEKRHYTGWGRLSKKLLVGIKDKESQKTILDFLINDDGFPTNNNRNFMQLINDPLLSFNDIIAEEQREKEFKSQEDLVNSLPGSPALKKGILQSLKIVDEIVDIMGAHPSNIVVEMARENQRTNRSNTRQSQIEKSLKELESDLLKNKLPSNEELKSNRLLLYYLQNGIDLYTGQTLDITKLSSYDLDHIIPQSFITDNSLDNLVLVSSKENRGKKDKVPSKEVVKRNKPYWEKLLKSGAMSKRKFDNLTKVERGGLTEADKAGFIHRQLVETRQITKHVARLLDEKFNVEKDEKGNIKRTVNVLTLKSSLTSQFRSKFRLYKLRDLNDYHHAHDAYLNAVVGTTLLKKYPNLRGEFVYGEFSKQGLKKRLSATDKLNMYTNIMNFFDAETPSVDENGEIIWSHKDISMVKKVLEYRQMNIVKKVEQQKGRFYKETIHPHSNSNKLIPIKNNLDTKKYGGYKEPMIALSLFIRYKKGKKQILTNEVVGIPLIKIIEYQKDKESYLEKTGYTNPRILLELSKYSLFETKTGKRRMLASATELQKGNQFVLPSFLVELLYHSQKAIDGNKESLTYINEHRQNYDKLMDEVNTYSKELIGADNNLNKINKQYSENKEVNILDVAKSSLNLMKFTSFGVAMDFDYFGVKINRYRYTRVSDIKELFESVLIYQSITGLYETRIDLEKL
ncbi:type II CRISPR RNA-guided endonuclease Cas9 [Vagococcus teuberi]|uniref:CRISPR-associated endonuclease Cas9 n=1 Tax=Vagococcus teuberi TaxID=519472 RepID=A0A1J0A4R8_9ENTE|nr:type II CRISPR RNA-guided endonuclease Cas9 [Vagococcus teuberi]APB30936.1 type II CRISPR RNA-guided endonuclease Cas9 [Vagococcus teuberi]